MLFSLSSWRSLPTGRREGSGFCRPSGVFIRQVWSTAWPRRSNCSWVCRLWFIVYRWTSFGLRVSSLEFNISHGGQVWILFVFCDLASWCFLSNLGFPASDLILSIQLLLFPVIDFDSFGVAKNFSVLLINLISFQDRKKELSNSGPTLLHRVYQTLYIYGPVLTLKGSKRL